MHEMQRKEELHSTWAKVLEKVSISPFLLLGQRKKTTLLALGSVPQQWEWLGGPGRCPLGPEKPPMFSP